MDFDLTEEQRAFQETARTFAREAMMPHARDWDEHLRFMPGILTKTGSLISR
jgi:alkylation response protein AidB-like acyl-CoA dehydrogenase